MYSILYSMFSIIISLCVRVAWLCLYEMSALHYFYTTFTIFVVFLHYIYSNISTILYLPSYSCIIVCIAPFYLYIYIYYPFALFLLVFLHLLMVYHHSFILLTHTLSISYLSYPYNTITLTRS